MVHHVFRIKRRGKHGRPGPPAQMAAAEIAYNEADDTLYYGKGDRDGQATEIVVIGGAAMLAQLESMQREIERLTKAAEKDEKKGSLNDVLS
jgi:hypothetical protein